MCTHTAVFTQVTMLRHPPALVFKAWEPGTHSRAESVYPDPSLNFSPTSGSSSNSSTSTSMALGISGASTLELASRCCCIPVGIWPCLAFFFFFPVS